MDWLTHLVVVLSHGLRSGSSTCLSHNTSFPTLQNLWDHSAWKFCALCFFVRKLKREAVKATQRIVRLRYVTSVSSLLEKSTSHYHSTKQLCFWRRLSVLDSFLNTKVWLYNKHEIISQMTASKFIITAAALSSLLIGASANAPQINSIVASSSTGFFGLNDASVRQGWSIATSLRGGSTGE